MGREIKFRAWHPKWERMMYDVWPVSNDETCVWVEGAPGPMVSIGGMKGVIIEQFTGLKDRNGVEIYEGSICGYEEDTSVFGVVFIDGGWRKKYPVWDKRDAYPYLKLWDIEKLKVVVLGNIHENPELLNG